MASILNQKFRGRTIFRVILFLPVILTVMNNQFNSLESSMGDFSGYKETFGDANVSFTTQISEWLLNSGIGEGISETLISLVDKVYDVIELSAIQILIMQIAMQAVPEALYEAATVEGATPWESFWKITVPMISPMIFTCIIYTVIDSFTNNQNSVMTLMSETAFTDLEFSLASSMGWIYFLLIGLLLLIVTRLFKRFIFSYN